MAEIQGIEFEIRGSANAAATSLEKFATTLSKLKSATSGGLGIKKIADELRSLNKAIEQTDPAQLLAFATSMKALGRVHISGHFAKGLAEIANAAASAKSGNLSKLSAALSSIASVSNADGLGNVSALRSELQAISELDFSNLDKLSGIGQVSLQSGYSVNDPTHQWARDMTSQVELQDKGFLANMREVTDTGAILRARDALASLGSAFSSLVGRIIPVRVQSEALNNSLSNAGASAKKASSGIKDVAKEAKKSNSPLANFVASLKRIAFYRVLRSILKSVSQAFQEGLKNAYQFSKLNGGALADSLDSIATKSLTMKNQLGAAFGGLLTALTPVILGAVKLITALASAITRLIAILGGSSTWLRAKDVWTDWGEAAEGAGGAAQKALEYLAPFDELNVLPDPKSGGGGGGGAENWGDMFETVSTDETSGFLETLKEKFAAVANWFESKDWQDIGRKAWETLKGIFTDGTAANEAVQAFMEAIGAAFGAVVGTAWGFIESLAVDLWTQFRQNLVDRNGNGLDVVDFLAAFFFTGKDIVVWVYDTIVKPFFDGFGRALTGDNTFDFTEWATENVVNPLIRAWNQFANGMLNPIIAVVNEIIETINEKFGTDLAPIPFIGELKEINISTEPSVTGYYGRPIHPRAEGFWTIDMEGDVVDVNVDVPKSDLVVDDMTAGITDTVNHLYGSGNVIDNFVAWIESSQDKINPNDKIVGGVTGALTDIVDKIKSSDKAINATANLTTATQNFEPGGGGLSVTSKGAPIINSLAHFTSYDKNFGSSYQTTSSGSPKFNSQAYFTSYGKNFGSSYQTTSSGSPKFNSQAYFTSYEKNFGSKYQTTGSGAPQFNSQANFTSRTTGSKFNAVFDSVARFYSKLFPTNTWTLKNGNPMFDIIAKIVGQDGTPTIKANIRAEQATFDTSGMAAGGSFFNNAWHNIPQFASGGRPHGSLFLAGENGAEIVAHVGGRTEVLNRSQIAATMYAAVTSALAGLRLQMSVPGTAADETDEEAMYRAFRRALDETDFGGDVELDGEKLYRAMVNRNRAMKKAYGINLMA